MKILRRALIALAGAAAIAAILRARGTGGMSPQSGGWRQISGSNIV